MANEEKQPLKVFLCHASGDKPAVRDLYKRLTMEGVDAWLDQEKLLPGQDWRMEIPRAVREADVVVICFSKKSITKEGYVQKEIKFALDIAEEKPEGTIFLIPARLEDCVIPEGLSRWQWVDLFDDNGYIKLLRSLKLRANAVGAIIEPTAYVDTYKELERRLEQLYTEGLAAFYTEDWDKACLRFQAILSEMPNHGNAAKKLAEAERRRDLARLYEQATGAVRSEDWRFAIQTLDELLQKSASYKDAAQLLKNARKQKQLNELYMEAKALHAALKWEAVVRVFEQISSIDSNYPDTENLLASAQKEVKELQRLAELDDQYSHALREMDAGNWYEARRLLESVHKAQTGYLATEQLLKKVEDEIVREEEKRKQNDQINTLYEQAHGLLRSKKWRNALDKMEEILKLDDHFPDTDGIAEKAQKELAREEQEAERQNKLAALYAEAVKLLKEEKYQEALDKWQEVRAIDPKYPDRQRVQKTGKRKLAGKPQYVKAAQSTSTAYNINIGWRILLAALGFGLARFVQQDLGVVLHIKIPDGIEWGLMGMLQGLIIAVIINNKIPEWTWKTFVTFGVCGAIIAPLPRMISLQISIPFIYNIGYASIPFLSLVFSSLWLKQKVQWSTYALIFLGWVVAWSTVQSATNYFLSTFQYKWIINDIFAGGIGLWITIDLLGGKFAVNDVDDDTILVSNSTQLLLWAFLCFAVLRAVWEALVTWLDIWDAPSPTLIQFIFLFVLGLCFGAVVAFSLKKVIPEWKWHHSLIVVAGWALGFDVAFFASQMDLDFDAVLMTISGLSMVGALKLIRPSMAPLKLNLIFVSWVLAKSYGSMIGNYLQPKFDIGYIWSFADAITVLFGILATLGIYEYSSNRLVRLTLISMCGYALGGFIGIVLIRLLSFNSIVELYLQYVFWGFIGGIVFELPSKDLKRILLKGGLIAIFLMVGNFISSLLPFGLLGLRNIIVGLFLGVAFGLSTRRVSIIALLAITGSVIFMVSSIYIAGHLYLIQLQEIIRGAMVGSVLGFGYAYSTRDIEKTDGKPI